MQVVMRFRLFVVLKVGSVIAILWIHFNVRRFNFRVICEDEKVANFRTSHVKCH